MRIGIDISQLAYEKTGVAKYLYNLVNNLLRFNSNNEYILFYSSLRRRIQNSEFIRQLADQNYPSTLSSGPKGNSKFKIREYKFPLTLLDLLWNKLHILPIEKLIGDVDIFITSDWTEPPVKKAKKATILYDLIVHKHPEETDKKIVEVQKRKLKWVKKESDVVFCISESTKKDAMEILGIEEDKLHVLYPGV